MPPPGAAERKNLVQVLRELRDLVIGALDDMLPRARVLGDHGAVVDHLVAGGRQQKVALRQRDARRIERQQLVEVLGPHVDLRVAEEHRLHTQVRAQVLIGPDRRVQEDGAAAGPFGQPGCVVAAQRGADQDQPGRVFGRRHRLDQFGRCAWRGRQLRADVIAGAAALLQGRPYLQRLA